MVNPIPQYLSFSFNADQSSDVSQFKPLSKEDREFLENAMEEFSFSDSKKISSLLKEIQA